MSNQNGNHTDSDAASLDDLEKRLAAAREKHAEPVEYENDNSLLGMAWRISTELVVAVCIGCAIGYGLDKLFNTAPIFIVLGLMLGIAAGLTNTFRLVHKMDEAEKERLQQLDN